LDSIELNTETKAESREEKPRQVTDTEHEGESDKPEEHDKSEEHDKLEEHDKEGQIDHQEDEIKPKYPEIIDESTKKRKFTKVELTESDLPLFEETSSTVAPHLYTSEPSDSAVESFAKHTGLLTNDHTISKEEGTKKKLDSQTRFSTKVETSKDESDEESKAPIALLDQSAENNLPKINDNIMRLENNNQEVRAVPQSQEVVPLTLDEHLQAKKPADLAQGKQPLPSKKTE